MVAGCRQHEVGPFVIGTRVAASGTAFCVLVLLPERHRTQLVFPAPGQEPAEFTPAGRSRWATDPGWPLAGGRKLLYVEEWLDRRIHHSIVLADVQTGQRRLLYEVASTDRWLHSLRILRVADDGNEAVVRHSAFTDAMWGNDEQDWWLESVDLASGRVRRQTPVFRSDRRVWCGNVDRRLGTAFVQDARGLVTWPLGNTAGDLSSAPVRFPIGPAWCDAVVDDGADTCVLMTPTRRNPILRGGDWDPYLSYRLDVFRKVGTLVVTESTGPGSYALSPQADRLAWEERSLWRRGVRITIGRIDGAAYVTELVILRPRSLRGLVWLDEGTLLAYDEEECMAINTATGPATRVLHLDQQGRLQVP